VKELFADRPFNKKYHLGAVNSINWALILAQTVYYFLAYFQVRKQIPHPENSQIQFSSDGQFWRLRYPRWLLREAHGTSHGQVGRLDKFD
jgi:hypothetical protein